MSDAENNDVENQRKGEKANMISSDESQDVDKDSGSDKERKVDVPRTKKEAPKTPKKEKDKELLPKQKSKSSKKENVDSEDEQDSSDDKDVDDDDEEEEDGEKKLALLDQPLQISGARERKKVERLSISFHVPNKDKKADIPEGDGTKLGDIPIVDLRLQKFKTDDLKFLHKLLFNRPGQFSEIKRNIRRFSGFTFKKDSPEFERKKNYLDKLTMMVVKQTCEVLDLERSGPKEELINRIMEFLLKPKSSGKKVPVSKSRKTRSSSANSRSEKSKGGNAKKSRTRQSSKRGSKSKASVDDSKSESSDVEGEDDEEGNASEEEKEKNIDDDEEEEEAESMEGTESEDDKKKKKPVKKENKSKASTVKEENKVSKKEEKKDEKKPPSRTSNKKSKAELSDAESSDDEPLVKKAKQPPTDEELKVLVKKILEGANLEEITMKTVCKQVYAAYPDFDLSDRKEFIKSTVRSIIS